MLTVDISLPDVEELHKLVAEGREKGFLSYDEIATACEDVVLTKEQVEDFYTYLIEHGVDVVEGERHKAPPHEPPPPEDEKAVATPKLDLTVDGADEVAPDLTLIKGGGGALLREKIVASASARMVVIVDESKCVPLLGRFPLSIEIAPFGAAATRRAIEAAIAAAGCTGPITLRKTRDEQVFVTDGGHWILDAHLRVIPDPRELAERLCKVPGVMEHGLFIGNADPVIVAAAAGIRLMKRRG